MTVNFDSDELHFYLRGSNAVWIVSVWKAIQAPKQLPLLYIAELIPIRTHGKTVSVFCERLTKYFSSSEMKQDTIHMIPLT